MNSKTTPPPFRYGPGVAGVPFCLLFTANPKRKPHSGIRRGWCLGQGEGSLPRPKKQSTGLFFALCGAPAFSTPLHSNPKQNPRDGIRHGGFALEQVKGVEPSSSAWKADVLAVVRHLHGICNYTRAGAGLSSRNQKVSEFLFRINHGADPPTDDKQHQSGRNQAAAEEKQAGFIHCDDRRCKGR